MIGGEGWPVTGQVRDVRRVEQAACLEHQHIPSRVGQRVGEHAPAEPRTDDHHIVLDARWFGRSSRVWKKTLKTPTAGRPSATTASGAARLWAETACSSEYEPLWYGM